MLFFLFQDNTACTPNPCKNGGTCSLKSGGGYDCDCTFYYGGTDCDIGREITLNTEKLLKILSDLCFLFLILKVITIHIFVCLAGVIVRVSVVVCSP